MAEAELFFTFDFESLYPNLECTGHCKSVGELVSNSIFEYYVPKGLAALADFLVRILGMVISDNIVQNTAGGFNTLHKQVSGLTTGLSAASTIANIYLSCGFDTYLTGQLPLAYYARYIDDGVGILDMATFTSDEILQILNGWHSSIRVPQKDFSVSKAVHFLDLNIFASPEGRVCFNTFRKPQAIFDYIPTDSAHAPNTFRGMIVGECCRLLITNTREADYFRQIDFFKSKLVRRGHNLDTIQRVMRNYPFSRRLGILRPRRKTIEEKPLVFGHGVHYFPGIEKLSWKRLGNVQNALAGHVGRCKVRTFHKVRPNIFLRLYKASWRPKL